MLWVVPILKITDTQWLDNWMPRVMCTALVLSCLNFWQEESQLIIHCLEDSKASWHGYGFCVYTLLIFLLLSNFWAWDLEVLKRFQATPKLCEDKVKQCVDAKLGDEYPPKSVAKVPILFFSCLCLLMLSLISLSFLIACLCEIPFVFFSFYF